MASLIYCADCDYTTDDCNKADVHEQSSGHIVGSRDIR